MPPLVQTVNLILSGLTVIGQVLILVWVLAYLVFRRAPLAEMLRGLWERDALRFAFIVSLVATLGSLFYSEIAHFNPCTLCWYQRIFMYPQVVLLGLALWKKDKGIALYSLALSVIGAAIAGYHYLLQRGVVPELPCAAVGFSESCSQRFVMTFRYITIPLMAFTAFLLIIVNMISLRKNKS
jgi:disulfide bond formation protein DsbB